MSEIQYLSSYRDFHRAAVKLADLREGDKVLVINSGKNTKIDWGYVYHPVKDTLIGKTLTVKTISSTSLSFEETSWFLPIFSISKL